MMVIVTFREPLLGYKDGLQPVYVPGGAISANVKSD